MTCGRDGGLILSVGIVALLYCGNTSVETLELESMMYDIMAVADIC